MQTSEATAANFDSHEKEIASGDRFSFGENWRLFLESVDESRIETAVHSLQSMLGSQNLNGLRFLDAGSGSGLFSLAANRLGANVVSFDYDPASVSCTAELRRRFSQNTENWQVLQGSVLDESFVSSLGMFDIVYSWGVLHHTGAMQRAIDLSIARVAPNGKYFIAIYNDQGAWSKRWTSIKRFYCSGHFGKWTVSSAFIPYWVLRSLIADLVWFRNPLARYRSYSKQRGMSVVRDWHDWLGGYPFEVAKPENIILAVQQRGFTLSNLVTAGGSVGCVEYVFTKHSASED